MNTLMNDKEFIGISTWSKNVRCEIERVAGYPSTVLITGPTGTGKEVIAEQIHAKSTRANSPFLTVDCASLPASLFESQLFGHMKGSFTGATNNTVGLFRAADGGTIFLDEIGELEPLQQAKLLRVLQTRTIVPVGSHKPIRVDVRVIAATNRDLETEVQQGRFREDLFYRLNVVKLDTCSLAERPEDIAVLSQYFLNQFAEQNGWPRKNLTPSALQLLQSHTWPGNVRELENMLERAALYSTDEHIECVAFPALADLLNTEDKEQLVSSEEASTPSSSVSPAACFEAATAAIEQIEKPAEWLTLDELERYHVEQTLKKSAYNQSAAARLLGVSRQSLIRKVQQYGIEIPSRAKSRRETAELASV